jgi:hypothetical protein
MTGDTRGSMKGFAFRRTYYIGSVTAVLLLGAILSVHAGVAPHKELSGDEARAVAIAVEAFSKTPSAKFLHRFTVTVRRSSRLVVVEFLPPSPKVGMIKGKKNDILTIQNFGRSAEYYIDPSTNQITKASFSRD